MAMEPDLTELMGDNDKAAWPQQVGYLGLSITNLNEYVSLFSHCLINIQNYQGLEIIGVESPIYLTRFDSAYLEYCESPESTFRTRHIHRFLYGKIPTKDEHNCTSYYHNTVTFEDKSSYARWTCSAYIALFYPEPTDAPQIVYHSITHREQYFFDESNKDYDHTHLSQRRGFQTATPQPSYYILVHTANASNWMRSYWTYHINFLWNDEFDTRQILGQIFWIFHLKTTNFTANGSFSVSILTMHYVLPFCSVEQGYVVIQISKKNWIRDATRFSDFSHFLPVRVRAYHNEKPIPEFFNVKFNLQNLALQPLSSLIDRGFAEFVFPNSSFVNANDQRCFCCELPFSDFFNGFQMELLEVSNRSIFSEFPRLEILSTSFDIILKTMKEEYTFLSYGDSAVDPPDFLAVFLPFSKTTWALIFTTIFGWPLFLSFIEHDFKISKVVKDFDALVIGWAILLEQSHLRATNYQGRSPLYFYCGCVLLAIFVISSAYKGDNVQKLAKSFEIVPLTHISQITKAGYKIYSRKYHLAEYYLVDEFNDSQAYDTDFSSEQLKMWQPTDHEHPFGFDLTDIFSEVEVGFFNNCNNIALLGWPGVLSELRQELLEFENPGNIYLGKEYIYKRYYGWLLKRYGTPKVLKRMWTLVESGIYNQLRNMSRKNDTVKSFQPKKVQIYGNIFIQFVLLLCGLSLAFLIFAASCFMYAIPLWFRFRMEIRNITRIGVSQSQKLFLKLIKYLKPR